MIKHLFAASAFVILISSCSSDEKKAGMILREAKAMYEIESYNNSKIYIDSLNTTFPTEFKKLKQANHLMRPIELKENERNTEFI